MVKRITLTGIGIFIFLNAFSQVFSELTVATLPDIGRAEVISADFNRDGYPDLLISGKTSTSFVSRVYRNNGDSTFFNLGLGLQEVQYPAVEVADLNNDNWPDFILAGRKDGTTDGYLRIFKNQHDETFQVIDAGIPQVSFPTIKSGDFNNDGNMDLFIMGMSGDANITDVYFGDGNLNFRAAHLNLPQLSDGNAAIADFNRDGNLDIIFGGLNDQLYEKTYCYINNGDETFLLKNTDIPNVQIDEVKTPDVNNDGYPDVFVSGRLESGNYITTLWLNNNFASFTVHTNFMILKNADMAYADYNHDGYTDIVIGGQKESDGDYYSELNENNAGTSFSASTFSVDSLDYPSYIWFDFNNDNKMDLLSTGYSITGQETKIYAGNSLPVNQEPNIPINLKTDVYSDSVLFTWDGQSDDVSPDLALSYELFLYDYSNQILRTPLSDISSGLRYLENGGRILSDSVMLYHFSEGKYYWKIQAIDQSFDGSEFSVIDSFFLVNPIDLGNDTSVCYSEQVTLSTSDAQGSAEWYSQQNSSVPLSTQKTVNITVQQTDTIWVNVTKDFGAIVTDTIIISMYELPDVELGADRYVCPGGEVELTQGGISDIVNWNTISETYSATDTTVFTNNYFSEDKVYVKLEDVNGCYNTDSVNILMYEVPYANLKEDTAICMFDTLKITANNSTDSVNWYSVSQGLLKTNSSSFNYYAEHTDTLWIDVYNSEGCMDLDTIIVNARSLPDADAGEDRLICNGYSTTIGPDVPLTGISYLWNPDSEINDVNTANPSVSPATDTKYYLEVTDQYGCQNNDSIWVQINPIGTLDVGVDQSICPGESAELGGNPTATGSILEYAYEWSPTENMIGSTTANPEVFPIETTMYRLVVFTGTCPADTLYTKVSVNPLPIIDIMNDTLVGFEEDITLWVDGGKDYKWTPTENLDNPYVQQPVANLEQTTHFTVTVTNEFGCTDTAGVNIYIKNEVFIPELFTPNNDGNNDYFKVYGLGIKELQLFVYNELGVIVYENNNADEILTNGWDGEYNGNEVKEGKYFWKINGIYFNESKVLFNGKDAGVVTLLR